MHLRVLIGTGILIFSNYSVANMAELTVVGPDGEKKQYIFNVKELPKQVPMPNSKNDCRLSPSMSDNVTLVGLTCSPKNSDNDGFAYSVVVGCGKPQTISLILFEGTKNEKVKAKNWFLTLDCVK